MIIKLQLEALKDALEQKRQIDRSQVIVRLHTLCTLVYKLNVCICEEPHAQTLMYGI